MRECYEVHKSPIEFPPFDPGGICTHVAQLGRVSWLERPCSDPQVVSSIPPGSKIFLCSLVLICNFLFKAVCPGEIS